MRKFNLDFPFYPDLTPNLILAKTTISKIRRQLVHDAFTSGHEFVDWESVRVFLHDGHTDYLYNEYVVVRKYWND